MPMKESAARKVKIASHKASIKKLEKAESDYKKKMKAAPKKTMTMKYKVKKKSPQSSY